MIELFAINALINKENFSNMKNKFSIINFLIILVISITTAYIAYNCNLKSRSGTRFIVTVFALLFSTLYLVFYFNYYIL